VTAVAAPGRRRDATLRLDLVRLGIAAAVFAVGFAHGGYSTVARTTVGAVAWWLVVLLAVAGARAVRPGPAGLVALGGLGALAVLNLVSLLWSHDATSAFAEFDRDLVYAGAGLVALAVVQKLGAGVLADGLALGLGAIAYLALASRCLGGIGADRTPPTFVTISSNRLSYPLDYWNGLAILVALAVPLLLWRASCPGSLVRRSLAAAPLPAIAATVYLASSRGGAAVLVAGTAAFVALTDRRWRLCGSLAIGALASAPVVALLVRSPRLADGPLGSAAARSEGHRAAVAIVLASVAASAAQALLARAEPASPTRRPLLGWALAAAAASAIAVALAALDPVAAARSFARSPQASASVSVEAHLLATNGSGRWQLWTAALDEWRSRPLLGRGAGSFGRWWLEHGSLSLHVRNAHSLYLETLGELGATGLAVLAAALLAGVAAGLARVLTAPRTRHLAAAFLGTFSAFLVGLQVDWIWQLTAVALVGVAALGALVAGAPYGPALLRPVGLPYPLLAAGGLAAAAALLVGLASGRWLGASYAAAERGDLAAALRDARLAERAQPWSTAPRLQLALLEEERGDLGAAARAIRSAIARDSGDWQLWLVRSRIELELGHGEAARRALRRAATLNPRSSLFADLPRADG